MAFQWHIAQLELIVRRFKIISFIHSLYTESWTDYYQTKQIFKCLLIVLHFYDTSLAVPRALLFTTWNATKDRTRQKQVITRQSCVKHWSFPVLNPGHLLCVKILQANHLGCWKMSEIWPKQWIFSRNFNFWHEKLALRLVHIKAMFLVATYSYSLIHIQPFMIYCR